MTKHFSKIAFSVYFMVVFLTSYVFAQTSVRDKNSVYQETSRKINALIHTKLDVKFDYAKKHLYGKEWLTLKPFAYATDSLTLDAKGMDIKKIALVDGKLLKDLKYQYDDRQLKIHLGKTYLPGQSYTVFIDYTSKPDELKVKGSAAITDAKGLYFINSDSTVNGKPVQIWTQGETEASSAWFPTIDKPNQKTTSEINITVPSKYVTLSNGKLFKRLKNPNGTRTDTWKMELPHSPYLFMIAVGNFKIYYDKYKTKEVSYYLEPSYSNYAKQIFGLTPEMMSYFSTILGVEYPWNKYSQIVVRDYVSGAMENTTATLHGDYVQRTPKEMLDENFGSAESTIAHELFHQWFGDYVTAESWSNLTVNESFANYSEVLWAEYKYGKDIADEHNYSDMSQYLNSKEDALKDLVRFNYADKEEVFDLVSYQKGGRILKMMQTYLGKEVFFKGLNIYLKMNAFKNAEAQQLRLAMEEASGKDLNWFFDQWYYNPGHPVVSINYSWNESTKIQSLTIKQMQPGKIYSLPVAIDIYSAKNKKRYNVIIRDSIQNFSFPSQVKPDLVNVDADKVILWEKNDNKSLKEYGFQYANAPLYLDRLEAVMAAGKNKKNAESLSLLNNSLDDKFYGIRSRAMDSLDLSEVITAAQFIPKIKILASSDPNTTVQAKAISLIGLSKNEADLPIFKKELSNRSYAVQSAALLALALQKPDEALIAAKELEKDTRKELTESIIYVYSKYGSIQNLPFVLNKFAELGVEAKVGLLPAYLGITGKFNDSNALLKAVDEAKMIGLKYKSYGLDQYMVTLLTQLKEQTLNGKANATYIDNAIAELKN